MKKTTRPSKPSPNRALRGELPMQRATPAFHIIRALCIRELAFQGKTTEEIAALFGVNRSFIIKQSTIILKPRTDKERTILKVAKSIAHEINFSFNDFLDGEDLKTHLAGAVIRGGKTYQNTPKTPQKGAKTPQKGVKTAPKTPVSRGKNTPKSAPKSPQKPRKPRLKMAAPQPPLAE
ncbi:MAG: hypothetical protein ACK5PF_05410 [bacterium]